MFWALGFHIWYLCYFCNALLQNPTKQNDVFSTSLSQKLDVEKTSTEGSVMEMSVCFSWALDPYIIIFRFCMVVVYGLYLPDE